MNEILRQRLVGALILLALGVIFWPIIFAPSPEHDIVRPGGVPPPPEVPVNAVPTPDDAGLRSSAPIDFAAEPAAAEADAEDAGVAAQTDAAPDGAEAAGSTVEPAVDAATNHAAPIAAAEPGPRTSAPAPLSVDAHGVAEAWMLQVASVSSATKADELRRQLQQLGHSAYVKAVEHGSGKLYRVYVGPKFEREQLAKLQVGIDRQFRVKSMILRHVP